MSDVFNMTDTWNNGATIFNAIKMNVTDIASDPSSTLLSLQLNGTPVFQVNKQGSVSIGSSLQDATPFSSVSWLQAVRLNTSHFTCTLGQFSNDINAADVSFVKSRGAVPGALGILQANDTIGQVLFWSDDGTNGSGQYSCLSAGILAFVEGAPAAGTVPGRLEFSTAPQGTQFAIERMRIDAPGNIIHGTAAIATNATDGFTYIATCAGTPTGTPTTYTGRVPMVFDTTNSQFWFFTGGAWKQPKTPAGAATVTWQ